MTSLYKVLHLLNIFLQIGKTFFTSRAYDDRKLVGSPAKDSMKGGQENEKKE
jgi:hypothetical protein